MRTAILPAKRYLIFDEVEKFHSRHGNDHTFRVRVWRGAGATAVVLVTPVDKDDVRPDRYATIIANWVYQAILKCDPHGMIYFNVWFNADIGSPLGYQVDQQLFEYVGHRDRLRLIQPLSQKSSIDRILMDRRGAGQPFVMVDSPVLMEPLNGLAGMAAPVDHSPRPSRSCPTTTPTERSGGFQGFHRFYPQPQTPE